VEPGRMEMGCEWGFDGGGVAMRIPWKLQLSSVCPEDDLKHIRRYSGG